MKKRILSTILAVLMLLGAVMMTACSNGTPANDEKATLKYPKAVMTVAK